MNCKTKDNVLVSALWMSAYVVMALSTLTSCIDEDLSRCGENYSIDYVVVQHTDLHAEAAEALPAAAEQPAVAMVEAALGGVFTDVAHDLDLSFYADNRLYRHDRSVIDASAASITFYMQKDDYRHLALANMSKEPALGTSGGDTSLTFSVDNAAADTIDSHTQPVFSARTDMPLALREQSFGSCLYMVNCSAALVLSYGAAQPDALTGCVDGTACSFAVNDSIYSFDRQQAVRMRQAQTQGFRCLYATMLPSRDYASGSADDGVWRIKAYVSLNGKTTESVLHINEPLCAGTVKIIRGTINADGSISTSSPEVGVSVTLDWKPGGSHDVEI